MDTRFSSDTSNSKNALHSRASNSRTTGYSIVERNSRNVNDPISYTWNFSNSRETSNRKPSGT